MTDGHRGRQKDVELSEPVIESDELCAAVDEQVLAELVPPVHLEHQAAKVAEPLLAQSQQRASVSAELARWGQRAPGRLARRLRRGSLAPQERPKTRHR
jgi:hypothetical protein